MVRSRRNVYCTFCGNRGPRSREDVIPRWIARELGGEPPFLAGMQHFDARGELKRQTDRTVGSAAAYKLPAVCIACNTGWMSELENSARDLLQQMIRGIPLTLDEDDQELIALWCGKTALAFDAWERDRLIPPSQGTLLLGRDRSLPGTSRVFIGALEPLPGVAIPHGRRTLHVAHPATRGHTGEYFVVMTFGLGYLLFQVWIAVNLLNQKNLEIRRSLGRDVIPMIAPSDIADLSWPPPLAATPRGFLAIARVDDVQGALVLAA